MRVLVVEDHQDIASWAEVVLTRAGHEVVICERPDLEPVSTLAGIDVALVDVNVPGGPGIETTIAHLREKTSARLLIWTAYLPESIPPAVRAAVDDVLHKPVALADLLEAVEAPRG